MVKINLIEALERQMDFCKTRSMYKCGIFVSSREKRDMVMEVISNIIPVPNRSIQLRKSQIQAEAFYDNGSVIRIVYANENARGYKFNGLIVDNEINNNIVDTIILPCLIPLMREDILEYMAMIKDDPYTRVFVTDISGDDVVKSKNGKQLIYVSSAFRGNRATMNVIDEFCNLNNFQKEYMCMFNDYDRPVVTKELNNDKVMLYEAWGIPKGNITYKTEFINKTKQTYLNVVGKHEMSELGFENDINIHLLIDTDVYDGYEINIADGMVMIILHEIKNEAPVLKDCTVA